MVRNVTVFVVGTFDTKGRELAYVAEIIRAQGVRVATVDVSTSDKRPLVAADISSRHVASFHPNGAEAVFTGDRGPAITAMAHALERYLVSQSELAGVIGLGGSGGTALVTQAMRALPIGTPRVMVSTMAAGNVAEYVGPNDICMVNAVTDVAGLNRVSRVVLGNAAVAIAGMAANTIKAEETDAPAIGLSMFGVTTAAVNSIVEMLGSGYESLVFHATGIGGQSMEKLADGGFLAGVIDITTTEVGDYLFGGVLPATEDRFGFLARKAVPYVGSCGALDMVNFAGLATVPERYRERNLYVHNSQVTLMRTTKEESAEIGKWIAERLNKSIGPVRFLIPEGGVSVLDMPGQPFHDPEADNALFDAIETNVNQTDDRKVIRLPFAINDEAFARAAVFHFNDISNK